MDNDKAVTKQVTSGTKVEAIGTVKTVVGIVKAVDPSGSERVLQAGDKVYPNETIVTAVGALVLIEFLDGTHLDLPSASQIVLDLDVFNPESARGEELSAERIQELIAAGLDPTAITAATAAGAGAGDEGGSSFVVVDFSNAEGNVTSGYPTIGIPGPESTTFTELPPVEEEPVPVVPDGLPTAGEVLIAVDEDDINPREEQGVPGWLAEFESTHPGEDFTSFFNVPGIGATDGNDSSADEGAGDDLADPSPTVVSGTLNAGFGPDGAGDIRFDTTQSLVFDGQPIESGGQAIQYWVSGDGHVIVGYITVTEEYGEGESFSYNKIIFSAEITDVATGAYTFTLYGSLDHPAINTEDNILLNLNFTVSDSDGDTAGGVLGVNIDDDGPTLTVDATTDGEALSGLAVELDETEGDDRANPDAVPAEVADGNTDDDGPGLAQVTTAVAGGLTSLFAVGGDFGADGEGTTTGVLSFVGIPDGGLATTLSATDGGAITLYLESGAIVGRDTNGDQVLTIAIVDDLNGDPQLQTTLYEALDHGDDGEAADDLFDETLQLLLEESGLVQLQYEVTREDADGDTIVKSDQVDLITPDGSVFSFDDDGPTLTVDATTDGEALSGLAVELDETEGDDRANPDAVPAEVADGNTDDDGPGLAQVTTAVAGGLTSLFAVGGDFGADGEGTTTGVLSFVGIPDGGLATTLSATDGGAITLVQTSGTLLAGEDEDGDTVFTIEIVDVGGGVYQLQTTLYEALDHGDDGAAADDLFDETMQLMLEESGLVQLQYEVTREDADGDTIVEADQIDLITPDGSVFSFDDDGPTLGTLSLSVTGEITHDETSGIQTGGTPSKDDISTASLPSVFDGLGTPIGAAQDGAVVSALLGGAASYGSDGEGSTVVNGYSLTDSTGAAIDSLATGLQVTGGDEIYLFTLDNGVVVGVEGNAVDIDGNPTGAMVFALYIDGSGTLTLVQYQAIDHGNGSGGEDVTTGADELASLTGMVYVTANVTVTDGDGDQVTGNITSNDDLVVNFYDDGPATTGVSLVFDESLGEMGADEVTTASVATLESAAESASGMTLTALNAAQGSVTVTPGADGLAGFAFTATTGTDSGLTTSVTDEAITWVKVNDGLVLGVTGYNGDTGSYTGVALSLHLDTSSGQFTVIQYQALTNPTGGMSYDELLASAVSVGYVVIDGDGDKAPGTITFNVEDDGLLANPDAITASDVTTTPITGNLLDNDVAGVDGIDRVTTVTVGNTNYTIPDEGSQTIVLVSHKHGNETIIDQQITIHSDGSYSYEVFNFDADDTIPQVTYTIVDGDGDTSTADIDFKLLNTAFLIVNTNNPGGGSGPSGEQTFNIFITNDDETLATSATIQNQEGQQKLPLEFDEDVVFDPNQTYTVVVDHTFGEGHTNITDFTLFDSAGVGVVLNGSGGSNNTSLVNDGASSPSAYDGVIYNLTVNGSGNVAVSDAIGYDLATESGGDTANDGRVLILDSNSNNTDFTLDFSDLPINGGPDLFGAVKQIDISGNGSNEDNTVILTAQDVLELGNGGNYTLFVEGDALDEVQTSGAWTNVGTVNVDGVTYDSYTASIGAFTVTLNVEQEVEQTGF